MLFIIIKFFLGIMIVFLMGYLLTYVLENSFHLKL